jgi:hypothetical protein
MRYEAEIKARIPTQWMKALEEEADREGLSVSHQIRKAIRLMLGRKATLPRKGK